MIKKKKLYFYLDEIWLLSIFDWWTSLNHEIDWRKNETFAWISYSYIRVFSIRTLEVADSHIRVKRMRIPVAEINSNIRFVSYASSDTNF